MAVLEHAPIAQRTQQYAGTIGAETLHSLIPNILVIDDEPMVRSQLSRLYEHTGYRVQTAGSAEEALTPLDLGGVDFVITDIKLPGMSGTELIAAMQENYPDVPVIAITGYLDIDAAVKVLKCGAVDFVVKPFDLTAVRDATATALEHPRLYGNSPSAPFAEKRW